MALTFAKVYDAAGVHGTVRETFYDVTLDSSYPTGGEVISAKDVGLSTLYGITPIGVSSVAGTTKATAYYFQWDYKLGKLQAFASGAATPAGTISAPTFTGSALAAHRHVLHFQTSAAANAVTAAANQLRTPAAAFDVAGVADSAGEGGIVDVSAGTPAGTVSAPTFTGTAIAAAALAEAANATNLSTFVVRVRAVGV
jgi:hypothetical protein